MAFTEYLKTASSPLIVGKTDTGQYVGFENMQQFTGAGGTSGAVKTVSALPSYINYSQYSQPVAAPVASPTPTNNTTAAVTTQPAGLQMPSGYASPTPATTTPAPTPAPTQQSLYSGGASYTGPSITSFLSAAGQPADFISRTKLATQYGIQNYTGTAAQNTQLLGILRSVGSGNTSQLGIPNDINQTLSVPNAPTVKGAIDVNNLSPTNASDLNAVLAGGVKSGTISSDIAGLLSLYGATTDSEKQYDELSKQLTTAMSSLGQEGADLQAELDKNGVGAAYEQVKQLNLSAAQLKGELDKFDAESVAGKSAIEEQPIPTGLITGQQAQYQKQRDLTRLSKAAELSSVIALSQAYQGNADLGMQLASKSIDLKYQPILNQIDVLKTQLGIAGAKMSREDQKRSTVIGALLNMKQNEINDQKATDKQIQTLAIEAAANGAPLSVVNAMRGATDPATAASLGAQWVKGNLESIAGSGSGGGSGGGSGLYIVNKATDDTVKKIIAQNPGEYGNAFDAIKKQYGDATAQKYDIWLRAVYNEGQSPSSLKATSTVGGSSGQFSKTQLNNGAQNAGVAIDQFGSLPVDVQNFFVSGSSSVINAFNDAIQSVANGQEDADAVIQEVNSSNLPQAVKDYLTQRINSVKPSGGSSKPGFFGSAWNWVKGVFQ